MDIIASAIRTIKKQLPELELRENEPMSRHCSFKIGGAVKALALPKNAEQAEYLLQLLKSFEIEPFLMGNGTNLLFTDEALDLFVIKTSNMAEVELLDNNRVRAEAGVPLSRLANFARDNGLSGLEFAHGIPGSTGGAICMNAGAYGGEMKDVTESVKFLDSDAEEFELENKKLKFSYRESIFSDTDALVLSAIFQLAPGDQEEITATMQTLAEKRRSSQPLDKPSAGSTFKRPKNAYAAALIDQCGLKGFRIGGAMVSDKHAGFVVNIDNASFDDVIAVMTHVTETVQKATGIELEPEVKIIT